MCTIKLKAVVYSKSLISILKTLIVKLVVLCDSGRAVATVYKMVSSQTTIYDIVSIRYKLSANINM